VPILFVARAGGFGEAGLWQLGLLGSDDITTRIVSTNGDPLLDFGHLDLFLTEAAEPLVWQPILAWIGEHSHGGHGHADRDHP